MVVNNRLVRPAIFLGETWHWAGFGPLNSHGFLKLAKMFHVILVVTGILGGGVDPTYLDLPSM